MQVSKIYRITCETWRDREYGTYDHQTIFEGDYLDKEYAEYVFNIKKQTLGSRTETGINLEELNVILNADGSYQEIKIIGYKKFPEPISLEYEKYRNNKIKENALSKLTDQEKRLLGL